MRITPQLVGLFAPKLYHIISGPVKRFPTKFVGIGFVWSKRVMIASLQDKEQEMGRASIEAEQMRSKMILSVDRLSTEDLKAMLLRSLAFVNPYVMEEMAKVTSFQSFDNMDLELDLTP